MRGKIGFALVAVLLCSSLTQAAVVDVIVEVDKDKINIGETATLTVFARLKGPHDNAGNGIFGWDVDLRIGDPSVLGLNPASLDRSGWTGNAMTSSSGTPVSWGLDAIYDTGENDTELGVGGRVRLFSAEFEGLSEGITTLSIEPDTITGADFVSWMGESGGDYSGASVDITVVPEPGMICLLVVGGVAIIRRRRV